MWYDIYCKLVNGKEIKQICLLQVNAKTLCKNMKCPQIRNLTNIENDVDQKNIQIDLQTSANVHDDGDDDGDHNRNIK